MLYALCFRFEFGNWEKVRSGGSMRQLPSLGFFHGSFTGTSQHRCCVVCGYAVKCCLLFGTAWVSIEDCFPLGIGCDRTTTLRRVTSRPSVLWSQQRSDDSEGIANSKASMMMSIALIQALAKDVPECVVASFGCTVSINIASYHGHHAKPMLT